MKSKIKSIETPKKNKDLVDDCLLGVSAQNVSKDISTKMLVVMLVAVLVLSLLSIGIYLIFTEQLSSQGKENTISFSNVSNQVKVTLIVEKVNGGTG